MTELTRKALVTDFTWPNTDLERGILAEAGIELIEAPTSDADTLARMAEDVDAIMFCFAKVPEVVVRAAKRCKVASRYGIGVDNLDIPICTELGIVVTNVPDYCVDEVADHVMSMLLGFNRDLISLNRAVRVHGWGAVPLPKHSRRFRTTTLGIVGMGRIGRALAHRAQAFGMRVLAHDPFLQPEHAPAGVEPVAELNEMLAESDFVSLHAPLTDDTRGMIGTDQFRAMRRSAFIVNAARGPLIDDDALVDALRRNEIAGAGLDVTPLEPLPKDHPLAQMDNVLLTPHTAFHSQESLRELETRTAQEVVRVLRGEMPEHLINPAVLGHSRIGL